MHYQISRNGQLYGPYTLDDLQRYLASGNVLGTDLAKSDDMAEWLSVSQLLAANAIPAGVPVAGGVYSPVAGSPLPVNSMYAPPPNLHWVLVLVISFFCSIFLFVWMLVQAVWMRQVEPKSTALSYYIGAIVSLLFSGLVSAAFHSGLLMGLLLIAYVVLLLMGAFSMKASLEEHYNNAEPIGLTLSPVMTFFFNTIYFQYHFNRINEAKQAAQYGATRAL